MRFTYPEFTALCPITGQPDFAHLVIDYVPRDWLLESKSLKLYLAAFRNHGAFHEACAVGTARRIAAEIAPRWLRIGGYWYPRGGMPIDVFYQTDEPPEGLWLADQGGPPYYRGRGGGDGRGPPRPRCQIRIGTSDQRVHPGAWSSLTRNAGRGSEGL